MKRTYFIFAAVLVTLAGTAYYGGKYLFREDSDNVWLDEKNVLRFNGTINSENFAALKRIYDSASEKPTLLRINSGGGKGRAGLEMGDWIREHDLDVYVKKKCMSACANFIFPAGNRKMLSENAILLWHGGHAQENLKELLFQALHGNYEKDHTEGGITLGGDDGMCHSDSEDSEQAFREVSECIDGWDPRSNKDFAKAKLYRVDLTRVENEPMAGQIP